MMKRFAIFVALILSMALFAACGDSSPQEGSDAENTAMVFEDITLSLPDNLNCVDLMAAGDGAYSEFSRADQEGFVDEKVIVSEETMPVFLYCHSLKDPSTTTDDMIEQYIAEFGGDPDTITVNGIKAVKTITKKEEEDVTYSSADVYFA